MKTTRYADRLDKTEPGLIVRTGNTTRKHISLARSGITLGRARGCDIQLEAPDVSAVHCVITRGAAGVFIRDCGSRLGTKVNGQKIEEAPLHTTDVVQVGSFSFEVYLPWAQTPRDVNSATLDACKSQLGRAEKSRERLAGLALHLRKKLHEARAARAQAMVDTWPVPKKDKDKGVQTQPAEHAVRDAVREAELLKREKALAEAQVLLDSKAADLERQRQQVEQARVRLSTSTRKETATQLATPLVGAERDLVLATLQARRRELEEYAGKLREAYEHLTAQEAHLKQLAEEVQAGQQQLEQGRHQLDAERIEIETVRAALLAQQSQLRTQQAEFEARLSSGSSADRAHLNDVVQLVRELCGQSLRRHESEAVAFRDMCQQLDALQSEPK
jgi:hypothetical protein